MKKLDVRFTRSPGEEQTVGVLAEDHGRVYFEYNSEFLADGYSLSPFRVPFEQGLFEHRDHSFGPLPGLFDDSLPDGWGLLLMDRHFRSIGQSLAETSPLDRLSWLGTRTMGALTYHPPADIAATERSVFDLHDLARHSQQILSGAAVEVLPVLLRAGGSPGGARPKVLVGYNPKTNELRSGEDDLPDGFEHWMVKFAAEMDGAEAGAIEYAYALMAADAGIDMPPARLFETAEGDRFFGIKRFDREGNRRFHVHTFGNLIHSNFRVPSADYGDLLKATSMLTRNHREVLRAFRRLVFNVLAHNRDDHVKNFAFKLDDSTGYWSMTPAYDLLWTSGPGGEHTMTVAREGRRPNREHVSRLAEEAGIARRDVDAVLLEARDAVSRWNQHAERAGITKATAQHIADGLCSLD